MIIEYKVKYHYIEWEALCLTMTGLALPGHKYKV